MVWFVTTPKGLRHTTHRGGAKARYETDVHTTNEEASLGLVGMRIENQPTSTIMYRVSRNSYMERPSLAVLTIFCALEVLKFQTELKHAS